MILSQRWGFQPTSDGSNLITSDGHDSDDSFTTPVLSFFQLLKQLRAVKLQNAP